MSRFGNFLASLEAQFGSIGALGILFGSVALAGFLLGGCLFGLLGALRVRKRMRALRDKQEDMAELLAQSRNLSTKMQAKCDSLRAACNGLETKSTRLELRVDELKDQLVQAQALVNKKESENSNLRASQQRTEPPTLIKRVLQGNQNAPSGADTGIIPDDQIIPTLPEAELTANVEAYDLSDLEELVKQDA